MQTRTRWGLVVIAVLLLGGGVLLLWQWGAVRKLTLLAREGGELVLREPMRPIRGGPRVLLFALDGVGHGDLEEALREGRMPRLQALLGEPQGEGLHAHGHSVPGVLSILPSTTMAAWASVFTGEPAGRTGIPGNEWFAREVRRFHAPGPVSVSDYEDALRVYTQGLLGRVLQVPTLYEKLEVRAHVSLAPVHRGADLLTIPAAQDVAELFGRLARGVVEDTPTERKPYAQLDESSVERLLGALDEHGVPDLQVAYFPGVDFYTHLAESPLLRMQRYLQEVVDPLVGRVLDAYAAQGVLSRTYVLLVSDHGHTPVLKDDKHALGTGKQGEPPEVLERSGFRLRPFELEVGEDAEDYQAVLAYQGAIAYVYLADRSTCPLAGERCAWERPPRLEEDVLPVVRAFDQATRTGALVPQLQGTLDLVLAREPRPVGEDALPFQVWDGERLVPVGEYLEAHPRPDLPALEERLLGLATGPHGHRAGDVLLLARSGMERPIEERYYFSALYHSWHGSPSAQDSHIPLVVAHPERSGAELRRLVQEAVGPSPSQLSVVSLILALMETDSPDAP